MGSWFGLGSRFASWEPPFLEHPFSRQLYGYYDNNTINNLPPLDALTVRRRGNFLGRLPL